MEKLTIFYDGECGICAKFRRWMSSERSYVALEFLPFQSSEAQERCPDLLERGAKRELIVMADDGRLWQGAEAWVTCLWALRRWRGWSKRLSSPVLLPVAAQACKLISANRLSLSRLLRLRSDREIVDVVAPLSLECPDDACAPRVPGGSNREEAK